jgi:hypothetical protein
LAAGRLGAYAAHPPGPAPLTGSGRGAHQPGSRAPTAGQAEQRGKWLSRLQNGAPNSYRADKDTDCHPLPTGLPKHIT